jgi:hypothetical protein
MTAPIIFLLVCVALAIAWRRMGLRGKAIMQTWAGLGMAVLCGIRLAGFDAGRRTLFDSPRLETLWLIFILTLGLVAASVGAQQLRKPRAKRPERSAG